MKTYVKGLILSISSLFGIVLSGCKISNETQPVGKTMNATTEAHLVEEQKENELDNVDMQEEYNKGVLLVKSSKDLKEKDYDGVKSIERLYIGSNWFKFILTKSDDTEAIYDQLKTCNEIEKVDFDYVMGSDGEVEAIDISGNPWSGDEKHLDSQGIKEAWKYLKKEGKNPGGSSDVVVAIIDTGVDYNHIDLRNNIWTNSTEIPNNGIDDDGNGYVDDYYGWDCVGNDNDPMDDNGHGTHVAGIVAAEDNSEGVVGIAYNCKIMCIKAGNSSGYFNNSDIAEAIQYAYMNGASVINMSFGGSSMSTAVNDALENAYNQCVLVAAAGNDGLCNNLNHEKLHDVGISYPAALPYVIGVMSSNSNGTIVSAFSNYDDTPFNSVEYEVYASGEQIPSTWPNNKIAKLSGTSMAAPVVSGIAALLRSNYQDRDIYSNKFIQSQILNTGTAHPYNEILKDNDNNHSFANVYEAIVNLPKPSINLYDYYIFDNKEFGLNNNGDGIINAGETIRLAVELKNRGGIASNVLVTLDTKRLDDDALTDPYFEIINNSITLNDIGTYSVKNCEKIYVDGKVSGTTKYFEIKVFENCPNDYLVNFNVHYTYTNGMDDNDKNVYTDDGKQVAQLSVSRGYVIPKVLSKDTVFQANNLYIVADTVTIPNDVTVIFEPGCEIQFYNSKDSYYESELFESPMFKVYGSLKMNGNSKKMINIYPSNSFSQFECIFVSYGDIEFNYVCGTNVFTCNKNTSQNIFNVNNSRLDLNVRNGKPLYYYEDGSIHDGSFYYNEVNNLTNSYIKLGAYSEYLHADNICNCYIEIPKYPCGYGGGIFNIGNFVNNILYSYDEQDRQASFATFKFTGNVTNNCFISKDDRRIIDCVPLDFSACNQCENNYFSSGYKNYCSTIIKNYFTTTGSISVDIDSDCSDYSLIFPFIKNIELINKDGVAIKKVGKEEFKLRVEFSRDMDTSYNPDIYFGSVAPYGDYKIDGEFVTPSVWEGMYSIKAFIENGSQKFRITNAYAKDENLNSLKELVNNSNSFSFEIDTTSALSMDLQAFAENDGVHLTWNQDDYDTLMGYNVYRSESKDGNYIKLNSSIILENENTFIDKNAEPGKTYWYTFTVVLSDFSESAPAGKINCTAVDTIAPNIYHTPVNQGYLNNNLVISCTASDNIDIQNVTLYYRTKGNDTWKSIEMLRQNDKFSATIFGSDLSLDGFEYYIVVSDGVNTISKGSADNPYSVIIKDESAISRLGDVDGDGIISTKDALLIIKAINGDVILTDDQFKKADLNGDEVLSSAEALRILQYVNGKINSLEM